LFNAHHESLELILPTEEYGETWEVCLDTAAPFASDERHVKAAAEIEVEARSIVVLRKAY
jgi:glycogen operon protein